MTRTQERVLWIGLAVLLALSFARYVVRQNMHAECSELASCESSTQVVVATQKVEPYAKLNP
jgi:hypothetical protein